MLPGSVEEEAFWLMAKKKAEDMRAQLKQIIILTRGMGAWEELLQTEGDIRKKRQAAIYTQEKQRKVFEWTAILIGLAVIGGFLAWLIGPVLRPRINVMTHVFFTKVFR